MQRSVFIFAGGLVEVMQFLYVNVYRVAPPPGGGWYYKSPPFTAVFLKVGRGNILVGHED